MLPTRTRSGRHEAGAKGGKRKWLRCVLGMVTGAVFLGILSQLSILTNLSRNGSSIAAFTELYKGATRFENSPLEDGASNDAIAADIEVREHHNHTGDSSWSHLEGSKFDEGRDDVKAEDNETHGDEKGTGDFAWSSVDGSGVEEDGANTSGSGLNFLTRPTQTADAADDDDDDDDDDDGVDDDDDGVNDVSAKDPSVGRNELWNNMTEEEIIDFSRRPASLSDPLLPYAPWPEDIKKEDRVTLVIVLTQGRMGSSLVGNIFDVDSRNFYLFEPFLKKHPSDRRHQPRLFRVDDVLLCQFQVHRKPVSSGLQCARSLHCRLQYVKYYKKKADHAIPYLSETQEYCKSKQRRIMKVIRIPSLEHIVDQLILPSSSSARVRIINLVRDPRPVMHSRIHTPEFKPISEKDFSTTAQVATEMCENFKMQSLEEHVEKILQGNDETMQHFHGYIRIRYEDFVAKPLKWSDRLYQFAFNEKPPRSVTNSIIDTNNKSKANKKKQSNVYDAYGLGGSGHGFDLTQNSIDIVEDRCRETMVELGYLNT